MIKIDFEFSNPYTYQMAKLLFIKEEFDDEITTFASNFPDEEKIGRHIMGLVVAYCRQSPDNMEYIFNSVDDLREVDFIEIAQLYLLRKRLDV